MVVKAVFPSDKDACFKWFAKVSPVGVVSPLSHAPSL